MFFWKRRRELSKWFDRPRGKYCFREMDRNSLIAALHDEMPQHIWHMLATYEGLTASFADFYSFFSGETSVDLGQNEEGTPFALQAENYHRGIEFLCDRLKNRTFHLSFAMAAEINAIVGAEIELSRKGESGKLRTRKVTVGMAYEPPEPEELAELVEPVFRELTAIRNPFERAVTTFATIAKLQLFLNSNKRTASVMLNGVLIDNGLPTVFFLREQKEKFGKALSACYNECNIEPLAKLVAESMRTG